MEPDSGENSKVDKDIDTEDASIYDYASKMRVRIEKNSKRQQE